MQIGFIFSLFFAIVIAIFALQNGESVSIDFIFTKIKVSQAIIIFVSAALGAIIVTILGTIRQVKLKFKIKEQTKKIKTVEESNSQLQERIVELSNQLNELNTEDESVEINNEELDDLIEKELNKAKQEEM